MDGMDIQEEMDILESVEVMASEAKGEILDLEAKMDCQVSREKLGRSFPRLKVPKESEETSALMDNREERELMAETDTMAFREERDIPVTPVGQAFLEKEVFLAQMGKTANPEIPALTGFREDLDELVTTESQDAMVGLALMALEDLRARTDFLVSKGFLEKTAFPAGMDSLDGKAGQDTLGPRVPTNMPGQVDQSLRQEERKAPRVFQVIPVCPDAQDTRAESAIKECREFRDPSSAAEKEKLETREPLANQVLMVSLVSPATTDSRD